MKQLTIQDRFNFDREQWLTDCRNTAKKLLRQYETITSEDVTALHPRPKYLHANLTGAIFQTEDFVAISFVPAKHRAAKGRYIRTWTLR